MSERYPRDRKYTKDHEWAKEEKGLVYVGITWYAQSKLKDIVYIELPKMGKKTNKGEVLAVVESVKTASDVYSPISGEIVGVNEKLERNPELINKDPYGEGWIATIRPSNINELDELLTAEEYEKLVS